MAVSSLGCGVPTELACGPAEAGSEAVMVERTHEVADGLHAAVVRAVRAP